MSKDKYIEWIDLKESAAMGVGYMYKGEITVALSIAQAGITSPGYGGANVLASCFKRKEYILKNPIIRPFRKSGKYMEFGIHDREEINGFRSVVGFFRFTEDELKRNKEFKKVKIQGYQEHEIILMEAKEKARNESLKLFSSALDHAFGKRKIQPKPLLPVLETSKNCKIQIK